MPENATAAPSPHFPLSASTHTPRHIGSSRYFGVESYSIRWLDLDERLLQDRKYGAPELTGLRATLMSVVFYQRAFLGGYATGLRTGDQARIDNAFESRARADVALATARQYLD